MEQEQKKELLISNIRSYRKANLDIQNKEEHYGELAINQFKNAPFKLYKYRECKEENFSALENKKAWFSNPNKWHDQLDFTISFDLEKDADYISKNFNDIILKYTKKIVLSLLESLYPDLDAEKLEQIKELYLEYVEKENEFNLDKLIIKMEEKLGWRDSRIVAKEICKKLKKYMKPEFKNQVANGLNEFLSINELRDNVYMLSLSETYSNDKQWDEYADHGNGFCIGYSIYAKTDFDIVLISNLLPILYENKKRFSVFDWVERTIESYTNKENTEDLFTEMIEEVFISFYTKSTCWSGEEEWRFRIDGKGESGELVDFNFAECIFLGENIKPEDEKRLLEIAKKQNLKVYRRVLDKIQRVYKYEVVNI